MRSVAANIETVIWTRSSEEEHRADDLALGADEGRDKLR